MAQQQTSTFAYRAEPASGGMITGTIESTSINQARRQLSELGLRVLELEAARGPRPRALRGEDFLAFNTQLAQLAAAGLPVEQGLRLIAEDMRSNRLAATVRQVAAEMEAGRALPEVLAAHAAEFPPLYAQLVSAGIGSGSLPSMLLNLGRHLELVARLRALLWKSISYPLFVFVSLIAILLFLGLRVFPGFVSSFKDFHTEPPAVTQAAMVLSAFLLVAWPYLLTALVVLLIAAPLIWHRLRRSGLDQQVIELLVFPVPLIGAALRRNAVARWCDALRLGVDAGLDMPAAISLATNTLGSPRLGRDSAAMLAAIESGQPIEQAQTRLIPPTVLTVMGLAVRNSDLPSGLDTLSQMFASRAETTMAMIPAVLTPLLLLIVALFIGFLVLAMFAPIMSLIQSVSGPS